MSAYSIPLLLSAVGILLTYLLLKWFKNPLRKIPGPSGAPLFGNLVFMDPIKLHMTLYDMAKKYGDVMKISLFHTPIIVVNSVELAYDALSRTGSDFQGRPTSVRARYLLGKDIAFSSIDDEGFAARRSAAVKGLKSYGAGIAHLEKIIQETTVDIVDTIQQKEGEPIDTHQLTYGYLCSVLASVLFGEQYSFDDPICQSIHLMNTEAVKAVDPFKPAAVLDVIPFLFEWKMLFKETHEHLREARDIFDSLLMERIQEAKTNFDKNDMKGVLDHLIAAQMEEDPSSTLSVDDNSIKGMMINVVAGGIETSLSTISQAFLDLLHSPDLQKKIQDQIDSQFEPIHTITLQDREKLPLLDAYISENLRYKPAVPFLIPHMAIRDSELGGYKIPAGTAVWINAFFIEHNSEVYDEPFKVKPERFLTEDGTVVPPGHPAKHNSVGFGSGARICPGKGLAKSRIFLFLANILQKFTIEPVGELPDRDVRNYKMGLILYPPEVKARFVRRQQ